MRLVIITKHYPYGQGEVFLEDEIRYAETLFEEIIIVTLDKYCDGNVRYVPKNANVVAVRKNLNKVCRLFWVMLSLFRKRTIREWRRAIHEHKRNYKPLFLLKTILLHENAIFYLTKAENIWINLEKETLYYAYWLDAEATYLIRRKSFLNGKVVARTHGGDCFYNRGYHPYRKEQLEELDAIFAISEKGRMDILSHYNGNMKSIENKIFVSRLGLLHLDKYIDNWEPHKTYLIISCSNIIPLKRLDILVDALELIGTKLKIEWIHFGNGCLSDVIKKRAKEKLSGYPNISFNFAGYKTKDYILRYYATHAVDLFVNCSDVEGIPVSAMEAMAFGIPVVARDVGANSELIDNECGILLSDSAGSQEYYEAIISLSKFSESQIRIMRKNAFQRVRENFSAMQNFKAFYELCIQNNYK